MKIPPKANNEMRLKTFTILLLTISFFGCGSLFFPGNVKIDNPSQVVADARALIKEFNARVMTFVRKTSFSRGKSDFWTAGIGVQLQM